MTVQSVEPRDERRGAGHDGPRRRSKRHRDGARSTGDRRWPSSRPTLRCGRCIGRLDAAAFLAAIVDTVLGSYRRQIEEIEHEIDRMRRARPAAAGTRRASCSASSSSDAGRARFGDSSCHSARPLDRFPARTSSCTTNWVRRGPDSSIGSNGRSRASNGTPAPPRLLRHLPWASGAAVGRRHEGADHPVGHPAARRRAGRRDGNELRAAVLRRTRQLLAGVDCVMLGLAGSVLGVERFRGLASDGSVPTHPEIRDAHHPCGVERVCAGARVSEADRPGLRRSDRDP